MFFILMIIVITIIGLKYINSEHLDEKMKNSYGTMISIAVTIYPLVKKIQQKHLKM